MAVLGLRFCARAFSSCGKRGPLFIAVCGPLTTVVSLVAEHRLQTRRLSNCGSRAPKGFSFLPDPSQIQFQGLGASCLSQKDAPLPLVLK